MTVELTLAQQLNKAWNDFDPLKPVPPDDPHDWYQDLGSVRATGDFTRVVSRQIARRSDRPQRVLLLGHPGCGKSTELGRLQRALRERGFFCVLAEADRELAREDLDLPEIQVLIVERIVSALHELELEIPEGLLRRLHDWFAEEVREEVSEVGGSATVEAGGRLLRKLLGLKAEIKVSHQRRRIVREKIQRRLREFVDLVAEVVGEATELLIKDGFKGLVLLLDGIEKAALAPDGRARAARILLDHGEQWAQLNAPLVVTAPMELFRENIRIGNLYDQHYLVPSVPVARRPDEEGDDPDYVVEGRARLRELVARRVDIGKVFSDKADFERLVGYSGGGIRDLFRLLRAAIDHSPEQGPITMGGVDQAWRLHALQVDVILQPDDEEPLRRLASDPEALSYDDVGIGLLRRELVLPYVNGGKWFGIHPAVASRFRT